MRKWHRWFSILFGVLALFIIVTGLMSHAAAIVADSQAAPAAAPPPGFTCPDSMTCRPKPSPDGARAWVGYLHHLHSGEEFGPIGTVLAIVTGLALLFFAFSGLWMYVSMFAARARKGGARGGRFFWK